MQNTLSTQVVTSVAELIQLSIAPVFLLAGVAGFLNVFTGRLARIIDRIEKINEFKAKHESEKIDQKTKKFLEKRQKILQERMKNTNRAIFLMTTTGLLIALVMITMFLSAVFHLKDSYFISFLFISSMTTLISSLLLFLGEISFTVTSSEKENKKYFIP